VRVHMGVTHLVLATGGITPAGSRLAAVKANAVHRALTSGRKLFRATSPFNAQVDSISRGETAQETIGVAGNIQGIYREYKLAI